MVLREQGPQDHHAAFLVEQARRGVGEFGQDEFGEALEGEDLQARVTGELVTVREWVAVREDFAFELKRGLLGGEQQQWRAFRRAREFGANLGKAAEGLAAARRAEEEARVHAVIVPAKGHRRKGIYFRIKSALRKQVIRDLPPGTGEASTRGAEFQ